MMISRNTRDTYGLADDDGLRPHLSCAVFTFRPRMRQSARGQGESAMFRAVVVVAILGAVGAAQVGAGELKQETKDSFARFRNAAEERINTELDHATKSGLANFMHFE